MARLASKDSLDTCFALSIDEPMRGLAFSSASFTARRAFSIASTAASFAESMADFVDCAASSIARSTLSPDSFAVGWPLEVAPGVGEACSAFAAAANITASAIPQKKEVSWNKLLDLICASPTLWRANRRRLVDSHQCLQTQVARSIGGISFWSRQRDDRI